MSEEGDKEKTERVNRAYSTSNMIEQLKRRSGVAQRRLGDAVIRVYDERGNVIETQEHAGEFKEW